MRVHGVSFNEKWVQSFPSAEKFKHHASNAHLFPELKSVEDRKVKLEEIYNFFNPDKALSNDSRNNDGKPKKSRRSQANSDNPVESAGVNGGDEPTANAEGGNFQTDGDNLSGTE